VDSNLEVRVRQNPNDRSPYQKGDAMKEWILYKKDISMDDIHKMHESLLDVILLLEHANEVLMQKIHENNPIMLTFLKKTILANNHALSEMVKAQQFLNEALVNYLQETDDGGQA